jgi:DNA-binding transcriptional ArsR family regulator
MSIIDVLIPAEPIVSGFAEPRLVSFADPEIFGYTNASRESKEMIHAERVRQVSEAMKKLGDCRASEISDYTDLPAPVVSRILQVMRRDGLVSSRRIPNETARMWVRL